MCVTEAHRRPYAGPEQQHCARKVHILYRAHHFVGMRVHSDGSCSISCSHRAHESVVVSLCDLDPTQYDHVFKITRVSHENETSLFDLDISQETMNGLTGGDVSGGKLVAVSAVEFLDVLINPELWHDDVLHMPEPHAAELILAENLLSEDEDEDLGPVLTDSVSDASSEEGFWDDRLDWYERAMARRGARLLAEECVGGSDEALAQTYLAARELALDVMRTIPSFFNDYEEIHTLACCCRDLRSIVLNKKYWKDKHINLVGSPLANAPQAVNNAATFFQQAATLAMEIGQLACVEDIPRQAIYHWSPGGAQHSRQQHPRLDKQSSALRGGKIFVDRATHRNSDLHWCQGDGKQPKVLHEDCRSLPEFLSAVCGIQRMTSPGVSIEHGQPFADSSWRANEFMFLWSNSRRGWGEVRERLRRACSIL